MKEQAWSPEPWRYVTGSAYANDPRKAGGATVRLLQADREESGTAPWERDANVKRAIACVNALAGIKNPEALGEVVEALGVAVEVLDASGIGCLFARTLNEKESDCLCMACLRLDAASKARAALRKLEGVKP